MGVSNPHALRVSRKCSDYGLDPLTCVHHCTPSSMEGSTVTIEEFPAGLSSNRGPTVAPIPLATPSTLLKAS
jgi:hypothetical protein